MFKLEDKGCLEDFLTEIFSEILLEEEILKSYCKSFLQLKDIEPTHISVFTQRTYVKLPGHVTDSKPDIVLHFRNNDQHYYLMFENKIEAGEGQQQLKRYADHLKKYEKKGSHTYLIYTTQYEDPKDISKIIDKQSNTSFISLRWYQICEWLLDFEEDTYIQKLLDFMEEISLNESRKFVPQDMYALQQMNRLQRMMDECLNSEVERTFSKLFGTPYTWTNRNTQLRDHNRYFSVSDQTNRQMWVGCGFSFYESEDYPIVTVTYSVKPTNPNRNEIIDAMKAFLNENPTWNGYELDDDKEWSYIAFEQNLLSFLHTNDHIHAIQKHLIKKLEELYILKEKSPDLGWK